MYTSGCTHEGCPSNSDDAVVERFWAASFVYSPSPTRLNENTRSKSSGRFHARVTLGPYRRVVPPFDVVGTTNRWIPLRDGRISLTREREFMSEPCRQAGQVVSSSSKAKEQTGQIRNGMSYPLDLSPAYSQTITAPVQG